MSTYRRVLARLAAGDPPARIAVELDRREDAVRGMIDTMCRRGHLMEVDCAEGACGSCPMADACGPMDSPVQYVVSAEGRALIEAPTVDR
ncbi:FeoC-like transcriptional regulator [Halohasta salina]|uniref:FeoC-like transcriptional regulator n=1 Tax=Halohasta salina TaxID=2961621 RepID=UPI0020A3AE03|nr:FeoC-like transcriptional regulator [Halohasta salina]